MFGLGMQELIIVGIVAVLLFGRKLPDVARSLGTSYREFRSGLSDIQSQVNVNEPYNDSHSSYGGSYDDFDDREEATAPRFEPPPSDSVTDDSASDAVAGGDVPADGMAAEDMPADEMSPNKDADQQKA